MFELFGEPAFWVSIALLIGMELALGVDNAVYVSSLADRVQPGQRRFVLRIAMALALLMRLLLLAGVVSILSVDRVVFTLAGWSPAWRDLVLLFGGLLLVFKAVSELYLLVEDRSAPLAPEPPSQAADNGVAITILQVAAASAVFSVDPVIVAVGISPYVEAMVIAVIISLAILYFATDLVSRFIAKHPAIRALALGLLLVVGAILVSDGLGSTVERPYLYGAFAFAILVLTTIMLVRRQSKSIPQALPTQPVPERNEPVIDIPEGPSAPETTEPDVPEPQDTEVADDAASTVPEEPVSELAPQPSEEEPATAELAEPENEEFPAEPATRVGAVATRVPKSARPRPHVRRKLLRQPKPKRKRDV